MRKIHRFRVVLSDASWGQTQKLELFALLNLGIVQSLSSGVLNATEAIQRFYHADNCLYVRKHLKNNQANAIMSHGVQLPDLFDCLLAEEAQREFFTPEEETQLWLTIVLAAVFILMVMGWRVSVAIKSSSLVKAIRTGRPVRRESQAHITSSP